MLALLTFYAHNFCRNAIHMRFLKRSYDVWDLSNPFPQFRIKSIKISNRPHHLSLSQLLTPLSCRSVRTVLLKWTGVVTVKRLADWRCIRLSCKPGSDLFPFKMLFSPLHFDFDSPQDFTLQSSPRTARLWWKEITRKHLFFFQI